MPPPNNQIDVLYEDNHLLVVNKPAMLPTMGVDEGHPSVLLLAKEYIKYKYNKPGNVYLGVVSRLDAPVTGVLLLARTSKAARRLSASFRAREVKKTYWAVVSGVPADKAGTLEHFVRKDERHRRVHVTNSDCPDAQLARLSYRVLNQAVDHSLLEIELETGRKHQIRVQLAKVGFPVLGDQKYGCLEPFSKGIALHARSLEVKHPVRPEAICLSAPVPKSWTRHKVVADLLKSC